jgi:hypothetical protein
MMSSSAASHGFRAVTVTVAGQIGARTGVGGLEPGQKVAVSSIAELKSLSKGASRCCAS